MWIINFRIYIYTKVKFRNVNFFPLVPMRRGKKNMIQKEKNLSLFNWWRKIVFDFYTDDFALQSYIF